MQEGNAMELDDNGKELISAYADNEVSMLQRKEIETTVLSSRCGMEYYLNTVLLKHLIREAYSNGGNKAKELV